MSATGPAADVVVTAGASNTVDISISPTLSASEVALASVSGLPSGAVLAGWSYSGGTVTLTVFNPTAADVTVSANSVTIKALVIGS